MMEEVKVTATIDQIEEFKTSLLWQDMVRELEEWKRAFNMEMSSIVDEAATENPSTASVLLHMGDLNGRQKAVDYFISLPDVLLGIIKEQNDDSKRESTD
jgi:hypothetical protein